MKKFFKKVFVYLSILTIVVQSLSPLAYLQLTSKAYAQEATPTPTPTVAPAPTDTPVPTDTATPTPTPVVTPTPTDTPIPTDTATPAPTPVPTDTVTPTPTPVDNLSPPPSSTSTDNPSPSAGQVQGDATSTTPSPTPAVSPTPTPEPATGNEQVSMIILKNISAPSLDLQAVNTYGSATLTTDKADYAPTDTALITGTGYNPGETYTLLITSIDSYSFSTSVTADSKGDIAYAYQLDGTYRPDYKVQVIDSTGKVVATTTFTDANPAGDLDQCANGGVGDPAVPCTTGGPTGAWQNGNLNSNQAHYLEGESVPYRLRMTNLSTSIPHTVIIEWDTTQTGKHALDYVTSFDRTETTADPCAGVSGCTLAGSKTTWLIPIDSGVTKGQDGILSTSDDITQIPGDFTLFNGTITGVSSYTLSGSYAGNSSTRISITFTAGTSNPVLAWSGHIATRQDWGADNSAIAIPGSPYHTRFIDLDGAGGNQDRSLSAGAVVFPGSITIIKDASVNGSTPFSFTGSPSPLTNFSLIDDGTPANTKVFSGITNFATYSVTETPIPAGWTLTNIACTDPTGNSSGNTQTGVASINLAEGENVTCIYTNTQQSGTLTVNKVTVPAGDTTQFSINTTGTGSVTNPSRTTLATNHAEVFTVTTGTYSVSETAATGWSEDTSNCQNVSVSAGGSASCTITNTKNATLKLVKTVTNDNGGNKNPVDWILTATGTGGFSDTGDSTTFHTVNIGVNYTLSESVVSGYTAGSWSCNGGTQSTNHIQLSAGQAVTCTINNNDNTAHLIVIKHVINDNGGTKSASDFSTTISGVSTANPTAAGAESPGVDNTLTSVGSYSVDEGAHAGYDKTLSSDCSGTIALGETKTCTITNNDTPAHLIVIKHVDNGTTGATHTASDFTMTINDVTAGGGNSFAGEESPGTDKTLTTVGSYSVTESGPSGYTESDSTDCSGTIALGETKTCTITNTAIAPQLKLVKTVINDNGGTKQVSDFVLKIDTTQVTSGDFNPVTVGAHTASEVQLTGYSASDWGGDCAKDGSVTLALGQTKSCTITNDDVAPSLTLLKVVHNNNGGTALNTAWTLTATGTGGSPTNLSGSTPVNSGTTFKADTYTLGESGPANYSASSWNCTGGTQNGNKITVALGESASCTITNTDIAPTLKLVKNVTNNNGGTAVAGDWTLTATGTNGFSDAGNSTTFHTVNANTAYTLSESTVSGYSAGSWSCDGGNLNGSSLTLGLNQNVTCQITNNDTPPSLTLVKVVSNTHGGNAVATDWNLSADGPTPISGAGGATSDSTFSAGTYTLSESTGPSGYDAGDWSCVKNNGAPVTSSSITLANGDNATCTIINHDQTATITLIKDVINDNGGTAGPNDFEISVGGFTVVSGQVTNVDSNKAYAIDETGHSGYDFVSLTGDAKCPSVLGGTVTLNEGESITCTIKNDDSAPQLHLRKTVTNDNGGSALNTAWTLTATGTLGSPTNLSGTTPVDSDSTLKADTYVLAEINGPTGYTARAWDCGQAVMPDATHVTVPLGGNVTCTINNNDNPAQITLTKVVNNNHGGTAGSDDFGISIDGQTVTSGSTTNVDSNTTYTIDETGLFGYQFVSLTGTGCPSALGGTTVSLSEGQHISCTITNEDIAPQLTVIKHVDNKNGLGTAIAGDFTMNVTATNPSDDSFAGEENPGTTITLDAGSYSVSEAGPSGYTESDSADCSGTINVGETKTCTITNTLDTGTIKVNKLVDRDGSGNYNDPNPQDFTYSVDTLGTNTMGSLINVITGPHDINESGPTGYAFTGWFYGGLNEDSDFSCIRPEFTTPLPAKIDVATDQPTEITLCNQIEKTILTITKFNDVPEGTTKGPGDIVNFTLTITATQSAAHNVTVTDLLPEGFHYNSGSWKVVSSDIGDITGSLTEPTYHSPGVWTLHDMAKDETLTLTYSATIDGFQQTGTYYDNAWGQGYSGDGSLVLAVANGAGDLDTSNPDSNFVGTQVALVNGNKPGVDYKSTSTQEVLGASTFLPATGENTLWVIIATLMLALGAGTVITGFKLKKKYEN